MAQFPQAFYTTYGVPCCSLAQLPPLENEAVGVLRWLADNHGLLLDGVGQARASGRSQ